MTETSVIIVNMNGLEFLSGCLQSLAKQSYHNFETILVDNGSMDGSVSYVRSDWPKVEVIPLAENHGFGGANNIGIQKARGEYIALLNNDTVVSEDWLLELIRYMKSDPRIGSCASKMVFSDDPMIIDSAGEELFPFGATFGYRYYPSTHLATTSPRRCFAACAGAALYRRSMLEDVGLLDDLYNPAYFEDIDLAFRGQLRGWECQYVPTAKVYHKVSATSGRDRPLYHYLAHRNREFLVSINMPAVLFLVCLPGRLAVSLVVFVKHILRGHGLIFLRAKVDFLRCLPWVLRKRKSVQQTRTIATKDLKPKLMKGGWREYRLITRKASDELSRSLLR
jgi:hypothetical protein